MTSNNVLKIRDGLINNIRGDGNSEIQESAFLRLAPKYYLWIYLVFLGSYLVTQLLARNFILQSLLIFILINLPGQAIMKFRVIQLKEPFLNFFLGIVLSLMSLMGFFFLVTVSLPVVGISKPLSPLIVGLLANLLIATSLFICAYARSDRQSQANHPSLGNFRIKHWIYGSVIIFFGFHSVTRLNTNRGDFESIAFTYVVFFLMISLFLNHRIYSNNKLLQILLFSLCLSALIAVSFRGDGGFNGVDINLEYRVAADVLDAFKWSPGISNSPYYAMLSITVLPAIFSIFTKLSLTIIFKLFYVIIGALLPGALVTFLKRFVRPQFAISTVIILILGSISYFSNFPGLTRQIIGCVFFIAILIIAYENSWSISRRKRLIAFLTLGLSFSHYSSAYLFLAIIGLAGICYTALAIIDSAGLLASGSTEKAAKVHRNRVFSLPFILGLAIVVVTWNGVITHSADNIQSVVGKFSSSNQQLNLLGAKNKNIVVGYLQANSTSKNKFSSSDYRTAVLITNYAVHPDLQARTDSLTYEIVPSKISSLSKPLGQGFANFVDFGAIFQKLGYQAVMVFVSLYGIYFFYRARREDFDAEILTDGPTKDLEKKGLTGEVHIFLKKVFLNNSLYELFGLTFAGLLLAVIIRASPFIGSIYNTDRAAFQISLIWVLPFALFFEFISQNNKLKLVSKVLLTIFATGVLFTQIGLGTLYNGAYVSKVSLVNSIADPTIISEEENFTARWVCEKLNTKDFFQSDKLAAVIFLKYPCKPNTLNNISPYVLDQSAFIFFNRPNTIAGVNYDGYLFRRFEFPKDYIQQYYSPIYVSDTTRLYR